MTHLRSLGSVSIYLFRLALNWSSVLIYARSQYDYDIYFMLDQDIYTRGARGLMGLCRDGLRMHGSSRKGAGRDLQPSGVPGQSLGGVRSYIAPLVTPLLGIASAARDPPSC
jgi:hypothetical protein